MNRDLTPYQLFHDELELIIAFYRFDLKANRTIALYYEVFILLEKRLKAYKVKARTESERFLTVLGFKTYLVYIPIRNTMIKTPFIKLYEPKNPLTLERASKPIGIRPLNNVAVTEDSTGEKVSLDLLEIDDISFLEPTTPEVPKSLRPPELLAPGLSKPLEPENKPSELMLRLPEELIKSVDSLDPDEMQLDLISSLCY